MSDQVFEDAYTRVRGCYSDEAWFGLSPREVTNLIYREMRRIDLARSEAEARPPVPVPVAAE